MDGVLPHRNRITKSLGKEKKAMSAVVSTPPPSFALFTAFRRFTVDEYHKMIESGILNDEDKVELLEG
jgi:hypothetical protein